MSANSVMRYDFHALRIAILIKSEHAIEFNKGSNELACLLLLGADLKHASCPWRDCRLMVRNNPGFCLVCTAAEQAVIQFFNPGRLLSALNIFLSDPLSTWRILELSLVMFGCILRLRIYYSLPFEVSLHSLH